MMYAVPNLRILLVSCKYRGLYFDHMSSPGDLIDWMVGSGAHDIFALLTDFYHPPVPAGRRINLQVISQYD